jgi:hypothetical protein
LQLDCLEIWLPNLFGSSFIVARLAKSAEAVS